MFMGIDPGLDGAIALYTPPVKARKEAPALPHTMTIYDMPTVEIEVGGRLRRKIDVHALRNLLAEIELIGGRGKIFIEKVTGMKGQAAASGFAFGYGLGQVHTVLQMIGMPFTEVTPQVWKKALKAPADKKAAIGRADELMPDFYDLWRPQSTKSSKKLLRPDRAEAAMLALYASTL
jgi:hypothetical protein